MKKKIVLSIFYILFFISVTINIIGFFPFSFLAKKEEQLKIEGDSLEETIQQNQESLEKQTEEYEHLKEEKKGQIEVLEEWKVRLEKIQKQLS